MTEAMTTEQPEKKRGLKDVALKVAGVGYSVGDLTMGAAAKLRGEDDVFNGAAIWLAGGIAAARYGNPSEQKQIELLSQKLEQHLKAQGIDIPDDVREQNALLKKPDFITRCENFLYQHPSEMLNAAYAIGAALLFKNGIKELNAESKGLIPKFTEGYSLKGIISAVNGISKNFWMGTLVGGGALAGLFIKEDPNARKNLKEHGVWARFRAFIEEKPLRLTGALYGANNVFTVLKAVEDYSVHNNPSRVLNPHIFSGTTAGMYILSNILLTTVSRDQASAKHMPAGQLTRLEDAAARVIAAQPEKERTMLLQEVSQFMAQQKSVGLKAPEIEQQLAARVAALNQPKTQLAQVAAPSQFAAKEATRRAEAATQEAALSV